MKSSSLKMIDAGIPKPREYRDAIIHDWNLPEEHKQHLALYLILETTAPMFFYNLKDGELRVKNKQYSVTWINSPDVIRASGQVLVSLRYCKYLERGYALVKVRQEGNFKTLEY